MVLDATTTRSAFGRRWMWSDGHAATRAGCRRILAIAPGTRRDPTHEIDARPAGAHPEARVQRATHLPWGRRLTHIGQGDSSLDRRPVLRCIFHIHGTRRTGRSCPLSALVLVIFARGPG